MPVSWVLWAAILTQRNPHYKCRQLFFTVQCWKTGIRFPIKRVGRKETMWRLEVTLQRIRIASCQRNSSSMGMASQNYCCFLLFLMGQGRVFIHVLGLILPFMLYPRQFLWIQLTGMKMEKLSSVWVGFFLFWFT